MDLASILIYLILCLMGTFYTFILTQIPGSPSIDRVMVLGPTNQLVESPSERIVLGREEGLELP